MANGKGEVKAASAEEKAKVSLSSKEMYAGASAEADFVKAEGSTWVSALGADVGVSGAVKVDIVTHAEAGYTDGKFKVDVGFEVDVSGTVDAVTGLAEYA